MNLFDFCQHRDKDPYWGEALQQSQSLFAAKIKYRQALQASNIQRLCIWKDDYYNLSRSDGFHTKQAARQFALANLKEKGFHVRCLVKNIKMKHRVIEHFFFCNEEQICLARWFLGHFLVETDATFNTNGLNMLSSVFLGITNTGSSFLTIFFFINSESKESFMVMFTCMKELMFYEQCVEPNNTFGYFVAGLGSAMVKAVNPREMPGEEAKICMGNVISYERIPHWLYTTGMYLAFSRGNQNKAH